MQKEIFEIFYDKETKTKIPCYKIPVDIYNCKLQILFYKEREKLEKKWIPKSHVNACCQNFLETSGTVLMRFGKQISYSDIVHETNHASTMILNYVGQDFGKEESEALAYLQEYLFTEILKLAKKVNQKISK